MTFSKPLLTLLSVGVLCCVAVAALQTFIFAPFAVQPWTVDYLTILGLFGIEVGIAVFSLREVKGAALAAVCYSALISWLWWHTCGGHFIRSDFMWFELPVLIFTACIALRSAILSATNRREGI